MGPPPSFHLSFSSFYEEANRQGANEGQLRGPRDCMTESGEWKGEYARSLSAKRFPGPQGPAAPASRESPGPGSQERPQHPPPFFFFFCFLSEAAEARGIRQRNRAPGTRTVAKGAVATQRVRGLPRTPEIPAHSPASAFVPRARPGERQLLPRLSTLRSLVPAPAA